MRGIRDVRLLFMVEPSAAMDVTAFSQFLARSFPSSQVHVNERRLGCLDNTRVAVAKAFEIGAEFAVLAEEDIDVSDDVLEYFAFAQKYASQENTAAVCAHTYQAGPGSPAGAVLQVKWFSPLVWGTWLKQWESFILPTWSGLTSNQQAWDLNLRLQIVREDRCCVFPGRSRSLHRGVSSTLTSAMLAEHFYKASLSNCYSPHYDVQDWCEVPCSRKYGLVVLWRAGTGPGGRAARTSHGSGAIRGSWKARGYQTAAPGGDTSCTAPPGRWLPLSSCAWAISWSLLPWRGALARRSSG